MKARVSICVLTYGDYPKLARRCLGSIRRHVPRESYRLIVGANAVGSETRRLLRTLRQAGEIDEVHWSRRNLNKCGMMRQMFAGVSTPFICWFDDDSYLTKREGLGRLIKMAHSSPKRTVMWGRGAVCSRPSDFINVGDMNAFVRAAPWYRGLTPPSWEPGGQGEFNFEGRGCGDGRWWFILGGFWLIRTWVIRRLDWPDRRLLKAGDDVLLGEALRQQGWDFVKDRCPGVVIDAAERRGDPGWV